MFIDKSLSKCLTYLFRARVEDAAPVRHPRVGSSTARAELRDAQATRQPPQKVSLASRICS